MIDLKLLGPGVLLAAGRPVPMRTAKTLALLAYLAIEPGPASGHGRARLAGLLWPADDPRDARHSLRQALHALRTTAGGVLAPLLAVDGESVRFVPTEAVRIDVLQFEQCVAGLSPDDWRTGAALYRAPLLEGRSLAEGEGIDGWLLRMRERLHSLATHNLDRLAADAFTRGRLDAAFEHADTLRALDACSETASRHLLRIAGARQDLAGLHAEWHRLVDALAEAYDSPPTDAIRRLHADLVEQARAGERRPPTQVRPPAPSRAASASAWRIEDAEPLMRAARSAERVYAYGPAVDLYDRALAALGASPGAAATRRLEVMMAKESALDRLGRRREQAGVVEAMFDAIGAGADAAWLPTVQLRLAGVRASVGDPDGARLAAGAARDGFRAAADRPGEAEALRELGYVAWRAGDHAEALRLARETLALHRELGDPGGEASALHNLAELHRELGSPRQALPLFAQALELHWAAGNHPGEVLTQFAIAQALNQAGDAAGAAAQLARTLSLADRHGERTMAARAWHFRATCRIAEGELDDALVAMRRALDIDRAIHYAHGLGHDLATIAMLHARRGELSEARASLQEAAIWFDLIEDAAAAAAARADEASLAAGAMASPAPERRPADRPVPQAALQAVRSSLPLAEGKVYCTFESPLARAV